MAWNLDDSKPVYLQIIDEVKRRIITDIYTAGGKLPSVRELALEAAVNPNTMQRALTDLERSGLIYAERTSGRFVTEDLAMIRTLKTEFAQNLIDDFVRKLQELGFSPEEIKSAVNTALNN